jgi:hypothetical protein
MDRNNDSQCKMILFWLKEHGTITAKQARELCQCERLAARISDLRRKGIPIKTETRTYMNKHNYPVRYAVYRLEEAKNA